MALNDPVVLMGPMHQFTRLVNSNCAINGRFNLSTFVKKAHTFEQNFGVEPVSHQATFSTMQLGRLRAKGVDWCLESRLCITLMMLTKRECCSM